MLQTHKRNLGRDDIRELAKELSGKALNILHNLCVQLRIKSLHLLSQLLHCIIAKASHLLL